MFGDAWYWSRRASSRNSATISRLSVGKQPLERDCLTYRPCLVARRDDGRHAALPERLVDEIGAVSFGHQDGRSGWYRVTEIAVRPRPSPRACAGLDERVEEHAVRMRATTRARGHAIHDLLRDLVRREQRRARTAASHPVREELGALARRAVVEMERTDLVDTSRNRRLQEIAELGADERVAAELSW